MKPFRRDILGQILFLRLDENRWHVSLERLLRRASPGGVLLSAPLPASAESTRQFLRNIARSLPHPPFLAVREEGGSNDPLSRFFPRLPSPRATAERGVAFVARLGELIGEGLSLLGFNTNFAPVLDLATAFTEQTLGGRTFGSDPRLVAQCGAAFLRGQQRHSVVAAGKHFPGWGSVSPKVPGGLGMSSKSMAALWREDLVPYRQLLPQLAMVLVSSAAYKAYDFDNPRPACRSTQVLEGLLRVKLGYRGLALAYEFESERAHGTLDLGEAAIQSVKAGCDMLIVDQGRPLDIVRQALDAGIESGKLPTQRVEQALGRVRGAKKRLMPPLGRVSKAALNQVARRFENFSKEFRQEEMRIA
jgi:beta-N-acetylhexosaminidase